MKVSRSLAVMMALFLLAFAVPEAFARFETNKWKEQKAVEKGGWYVTYGNELTKQQLAEGVVEPGIHIYTGQYPGERNLQLLHSWAESMIRQSIVRMENSLGTAAVRNFGLEEQKKARKTTLRTVRSLLRGKQPGVSETLVWGSVEFKTGLSKYIIHNNNQWNNGLPTGTFVPYVALRMRPAPAPVAVHTPAPSSVVPSSPYQNYPPVSQHPTTPQYNDPQQYSLPTQAPIQQRPIQKRRATSKQVLNALSLGNTARNLSKKRWEWTAKIDGPTKYLRRVSAVTYFLHPSFKPNVYPGNAALPGHPFTATGWGVFELKAEVTLKDGTKRTYRHMLRFN